VNIETGKFDFNEANNREYARFIATFFDLDKDTEAELLKQAHVEGGIVQASRRLLTKFETESELEPVKNVMRWNPEPIDRFTISEAFTAMNAADTSLLRAGFITIGGEMSSGKTSFTTALGLDAVSTDMDTAFLFYSLDDSGGMTAIRILQQVSGRHLLHQPETEIEAVKRDHAELLKRVYVMDGLTLDRLPIEAQAVRTETGCSRLIIGIDYLQAVKPPNPESDRRAAYNDILAHMKRYQIELNAEGPCMMLCLSQMNRSSSGGALRYRETSEIENKSDVCLDMELPTKTINGQTVPDRSSMTRYITVQKNKAGRRGMQFETRINPNFTFEPVAPRDYRNADDADDGETISTKGQF
jgi:hypothetical protein